MGTLGFAPEADEQWASIIERDTLLAEVLDGLLDAVESGEEPGRRRGDQRFCTTRVRGRDDLYVLVWEPRDDGPYVTYIGRSPLG